MRSRPFVAAAAALSLALSAAACGGDEPEGAGAPPTSNPVPSSPIAPMTTPASSPDDATEDASGDKGSSSDDRGSSKGGEDGPPEAKPSSELLPAVATQNSDLTNFTTALTAAGLTATLGQPGPYTVFAPNNDGFAKLGTRLDALLQPAAKAELVNILSYHVVSGEHKLQDLKDGELLTTLQGTRLRVQKKRGEITIGNSVGEARLVSSNIDAGNGVIHAIDSVLTPKTK